MFILWSSPLLSLQCWAGKGLYSYHCHHSARAGTRLVIEIRNLKIIVQLKIYPSLLIRYFSRGVQSQYCEATAATTYKHLLINHFRLPRNLTWRTLKMELLSFWTTAKSIDFLWRNTVYNTAIESISLEFKLNFWHHSCNEIQLFYEDEDVAAGYQRYLVNNLH